MSCTDVPKILEDKPHRSACKRLAELLPDCCCEHESVCPELSPGVVQDHETLARFVPAKDLDPETSGVKPSLFEKASENGMSVTRLDLAGEEIVYRQQIEGNFSGFVTALCQDIRSKMHEGRRLFCVYDTALGSNTNHADVCQAIGSTTGSAAIKLRRELQLTFTRIIVGR